MSNTITEVRLLAVPLENDYAHTLYFASASAQTTYFQSRTVKNRSDFSYQRKDKIIRYPEHVDTLLGCNYVMYKNSDFSSKWYYAFITKMEYISDERTNIYIETDVIQTWLFDYNVKASFVEREHVDNDAIGDHTVPEQLETGEYICRLKNSDEMLTGKTYIVASTVDLNGAEIYPTTGLTFDNVSGRAYGGIYSGVRYFAYATTSQLNNVLRNVAEGGKSDAIASIFVIPSSFVDELDGHDITAMNKSVPWERVVIDGETSQGYNYKPDGLKDYTPRNNKLLTYPYMFMQASNNAGGSAIYHYEKFNMDDPLNDKCDFKIYGAITPSFSGKLIPLNYDGIEENWEEGLVMGKLPICSWNTDIYTNWLTQNAVNIGIQAVTSAGSIVAGGALMATGGGVMAGGAMIAGGVMGITNSVAQVHQHSFTPPQAEGNLNSGDVTFSSDNLTFTIYHMCIRKEYAQIIDDYFDMFGYKVNRVKVPNKNHRPYYWFTKTIDVNIDGNVPMDDLRKIKECYNKGITFWKSNIGDYSVNNSIR